MVCEIIVLPYFTNALTLICCFIKKLAFWARDTESNYSIIIVTLRTCFILALISSRIIELVRRAKLFASSSYIIVNLTNITFLTDASCSIMVFSFWASLFLALMSFQ